MSRFYHSLEAVQLENSWLTIGVFDGVHHGHQQIIHQLTAGAHANGAPAVVLTFEPHPAKVLAGREIKCLTTLPERADLLFGLGVDVVICMSFTRELASHSAEDFMAVLKKQLGLSHLLIGYDFALGKDRAGNYERLAQIGQELGYQVQAIAALRQGEQITSSTLLRQAIAEGQVRQAADMLGRLYSVSGAVVPGDGRGRTIGIPTANVDFPLEKAIPANGVYACWVQLNGARHAAVANVGLRPTFTTGEVLPRLEAHLLDYDADLYGQNLTVEFVERLRAEQKFSGVDALIAQIHADIESAKKLLV